MPTKIISVLHHSIPSLTAQHIAEENGLGWHFRSARALKEIARIDVECVRPSGTRESLVKIINGIPVILTSTLRLSPSKSLWKWSEVSPELIKYVTVKVKKHEYIPYIHEYRTLNSELIIRKLIELPMILQHHGSSPPTRSPMIGINPLSVVRGVYRAEREKLLRKITGAIFVLNESEKKYLEGLGVKASVKIRPMAVDFNELKLVTDEEKRELRRVLGIPEDHIVLCSYVGVFREDFSKIKGAHLIAKVWKELNLRSKKSLTIIVSGLGARWIEKLKGLGIRAYPFLPHNQYLSIVKASDAYFVPATRGYYYGGCGVAVMEALALGKPVVSPTLIHFPERDMVRYIGAVTPFLDTEDALRIFVERLLYVIEELSSFKAERIRQIAYKHYSWESFVEVFKEILEKM